jgi:zinc protease
MARLLAFLWVKLCARWQQTFQWKVAIPNSKHEFRISKQIQIFQIQKSFPCLGFLSFWVSNLFRISIFGFRIFHFPIPVCFPLARLRSSVVFGFFLLIFTWMEGAPLAMPPVQRMTLSNQMVLLTSEEHSLPFVTLQLLIDAGSRRDATGEEGTAKLTAQGLLLGTAKRGEKAINEELDFMGASLNSSSGRDYATLTLRVLKKDLDKGFDLFMEVLTQPTFPQEEVKREIQKTLAAIQAAEDQPEEVAEKAFQENLFLSGPYRHPVEGTKKSLPSMTRDTLERFYKKYYHSNHSILAVGGDITPEEVRTRLVPRLEKWFKGKIFATPAPARNVFAKGPKTVKIDRMLTQASIILGHAGVSRDNPDYYALTVMNYILGGGGFSSRLMEEVRNKKGLAYSVYSFFHPGKLPGSFQVGLQTKNVSAREAISIVREEMKRIQKEPVSEKEIEGARKYLIGSFPMRMDTQGKLVNFLLQVEYYGLGLDYPERYSRLIQSITWEDVLRVARKYLQPENCILVVVANQKMADIE